MEELTIYSQRYDPDALFKAFKDNIGRREDITQKRYNESYIDYCKLMMAERQAGSTLSLGQQGKAQKKLSGIRAIRLDIDDQFALLGLMSCPTGLFQCVDQPGWCAFDRFVDMGNQGKRMELVKVYLSGSTYAYNLAKSLLRSQRRRRMTLRQGVASVNSAIKSKASNLYGWVNGKVADWRRDEPFGYLDDEANHPGMIDF